MNRRLTGVFFAGLLALSGATLAADKKADPAHIQNVVGDHMAMAEAHVGAAKCLQAGKAEKQCHEQLERDCKGLGIGKYCGMRHKH
jgi:hypothetical protein